MKDSFESRHEERIKIQRKKRLVRKLKQRHVKEKPNLETKRRRKKSLRKSVCWVYVILLKDEKFHGKPLGEKRV